jgi:hypothetical protein
VIKPRVNVLMNPGRGRPALAPTGPPDANDIRLPKGVAMDLMYWMPGLFLLGLVTMALMLAFVWACEKV